MALDEGFNEPLVLERLVALRKKAGLTQKMVESRLNWRQGTLYDYEKARLKISLEATWQLLQLYGGRWEELFEEDPQSEGDVLGSLIGPLAQLGMISQHMQDLIQRMRQDPILIAEVGIESMQGSTPVLHLLLDKLTDVQRREYFIELCRYVNSMIAVDHKIKPEEKKIRAVLLQYAPMNFDDREKISLLRAFETQYFGKGIDKKFPREALKHLLIWILFIISLSDGDINHLEQTYIEAVGENIEFKKSSYDYIKSKIMLQPR